jgi:hypothetical protein
MIRCLDDVDDEVRDRAAMYYRTMNDKQLADAYLREGKCSYYLRDILISYCYYKI